MKHSKCTALVCTALVCAAAVCFPHKASAQTKPEPMTFKQAEDWLWTVDSAGTYDIALIDGEGSWDSLAKTLRSYYYDNSAFRVNLDLSRLTENVDVAALYPLKTIVLSNKRGAAYIEDFSYYNEYDGQNYPRAFRSCISLENITFPEGVTGIGRSAFENCTSLKSITI